MADAMTAFPTGSALPFADTIEGDYWAAVKYERRQRCDANRRLRL